MDGGITSDAQLDFAEFHIFPSQNRYKACVCIGDKVEILLSGLLEQLSLHLMEVNNLYSKGSDANLKLPRPDNTNDAKWFTKSTLTRFLYIVNSPDIVSITDAVEKEISQLEDTKRFHLTLHEKVCQGEDGNEDTESSCSKGVAPTPKDETDITSSDATKSELLRALDLRLIALRGKLADAFNRAAGGTCSPEEIIDLENLSHHVGATDLRNSLRKFLKLRPEIQNVDSPHDSKSPFLNGSKNEKTNEIGSSAQILNSSQLDTPVKYGVSPAKVAQVEQQSLSESEESSFSSEEDQPPVARSRTLVRSASLRRSASPMRRIQIGRSGAHRAAALTIRSLNHFPARERVVSSTDAAANSGEEEASEQPSKNSANNVQRMSVQDAISLFESKERDQTLNMQKTRSLINAFGSANKSVLRRWSAGMGESLAQSHEDVSETSAPTTSNSLGNGQILKSSPEDRQESDSILGDHIPVETAEGDIKSECPVKGALILEGMQVDSSADQIGISNEKLISSAEWNRQKEAELNEMLMKMMESKPVRHLSLAVDNNKSQNVSTELGGESYNHHDEKKDEKLQGETAWKLVEEEAQIRVMRQIPDERKTEMASANANGIARQHDMTKPQKPPKTLSQSAKVKKETPKPAIVKKASSKASSLPPTRKSWPSTLSGRAAWSSPAKTPVGRTSAGAMPTLKKSQLPSSAPRSSPKVERLQLQQKTVKGTQNDANKGMKGANAKKLQTLTENGKATKPKVQKSRDLSTAAKHSFHSKVTKKSSVVPLETKPFLRKGSGTGSVVGSNVKTKVSSQPEESLGNSVHLCPVAGIEDVPNPSDLVSQVQEKDPVVPEIHADIETEAQMNIPQICEDTESSNQVTTHCDDSFTKTEESTFTTEVEEESTLSPVTWVEIGEHQDQPIPCNETPCLGGNSVPAPRVRHSLSQMLLEESSEPDIVEWGNAENPPLVYQKDARKGLKRLLKFARKSKADANLTSWSSPSTLSEGEDDVEESKAFTKKNADNMLRKVAHNVKYNGQPKTSSSEAYEKKSVADELSAESNISIVTAQSSYNLLDRHVSASRSTTKAARSFFSLSAFKGSKPNETKLL